jgi:hypothetical protein
VEDYGDIFMWRARYDFGDPEARDKVQRIAGRLRNGGIPVVALTALMDLPPIREALRERYQTLGTLPIDGPTEILIPR